VPGIVTQGLPLPSDGSFARLFAIAWSPLPVLESVPVFAALLDQSEGDRIELTPAVPYAVWRSIPKVDTVYLVNSADRKRYKIRRSFYGRWRNCPPCMAVVARLLVVFPPSARSAVSPIMQREAVDQ
jgi:hypothetical protein